MSCFTCATKFSWRKKELGCKHCGKAFCKDCLSHKVYIPRLKADEHVCNQCFHQLTHSKAKEPNNASNLKQVHDIDDPNTYLGPSMKDIAAKKISEKSSVNDPDSAIKDRLKKLKQDDSPKQQHTDEDIRRRLDDVSGRKTIQSGKNILTPQKRLGEEDEVLKLLAQTKEEVGIDNRYGNDDDSDGDETVDHKVKDMESRLLKLKGIDPEKANKKSEGNDSSEDEVEATSRIIKKALAESQLDDKIKEDGYGDLIAENSMKSKLPQIPSTLPGTKKYNFSGEAAGTSDDEELPWCCICNNDAVVRCHDCDDDLYCKRCFREGHDEYDMKHHKTSVYKQKKKR